MGQVPPSVESSEPSQAVMAHVLFADVIGYSKLPIDAQARVLQRLRQAVRGSPQFEKSIASDQIICLATGDGAALTFFDDVCAPIRCATEINRELQDDCDIKLRIGIHSGYVFRVTDINGKANVAGGGINFAQRVMDCGDAGHILLSGTHAELLGHFGSWKTHLHDLGEIEVKHGVKLRVFNYCNGATGRRDPPARIHAISIGGQQSGASRPCGSASVVLIYRRDCEPDAALLGELENRLSGRGYQIFIDRHLQIGVEWAKQITSRIQRADAVVPLLSAASVQSEMLAFELQIANEAAQRQAGKPRLLPVRVNWEEPLPGGIAPFLERLQYALWRGPQDTERLIDELSSALEAPPEQSVRRRVLEPPGGAVPLESPYYVVRPFDEEFLNAVARRDSIVLLEGARQMGKTSLLSRGLQAARGGGAQVVCTDFQTVNEADLSSLESFYIALGNALADQLDLDVFPQDVWRKERGPNANFERYLRREVLEKISVPIVWGLDEVDRLFTCKFGSEVFGLFRSWHNARALDPSSPWRRLTQVIAYATEAHLFITDLNQSPFNVGTKIRLRDFSAEETADLNRRYGNPLPDDAAITIFRELVGGQPYLVRRGLHELAGGRITLNELRETAIGNEGPFGDHLRRFLVLLARDEPLMQAVRETLTVHKFPEARLFQRLRAAGLVLGEHSTEARFRCGIYERYLRQHLA